MAKESRSERSSSKGIQATPSQEVQADRGSAGDGSAVNSFIINDQGEYCVGTKCFSMRFKPGAGEVRVIVDRNECGVDAQPIVDALFGEVVKGATTVYETKSKDARQRQE